MILYDIRDNNCIQPCRSFTIRGEIISVKREVRHTEMQVAVFNYQEIDNKPDIFTVYFREHTKKVVDSCAMSGYHAIVTGDILIRNGALFLEGKVIELFKSMEFAKEGKAKFVDPKEANYDRAF